MNRQTTRALTRINREFQGALEKSVVSLYHYNGCGFFDGGCLLLADALVEWGAGCIQLAAIVRERFGGSIDHWVVKFDLAGETVYLDANGVQDAPKLLRYWSTEELHERVMLVASPVYDEHSEIPRDLDFSRRLAGEILVALGPYAAWKAKLDLAVEAEASPSPS